MNMNANPNKALGSLVYDCPICNAKNSTFDVKGFGDLLSGQDDSLVVQLFSICRACSKAICIDSVFKKELFNNRTTALKIASSKISLVNYVALYLKERERDFGTVFSTFTYIPVIPKLGKIPEHLPKDINDIFLEAIKCNSLNCYNAAAAMFRLCLDKTTKDLLNKNKNLNPTVDNSKTIHKRLIWIFQNKLLHSNLEELSKCIKDDGNDAAHDGNIGKVEANDLFDFTYEFLEQVYTQPERVRIAKERREQRRSQ